MDYKQAAQTIRDTVPTEEILRLYGYQTRKGFMACPFHGDKAPSLKVYPGRGGWHCFGCGRGGSVIDFVREQEGCDFRTAVRAIDSAMRLNLFDENENAFDEDRKRRIQEWLDDFVKFVGEECERKIRMIEGEQTMRLRMVKLLEEKRDTDKQSVTADEWTCLLRWQDDDEYDEYRKEKIIEFEEEVAAWRRAWRRAASA